MREDSVLYRPVTTFYNGLDFPVLFKYKEYAIVVQCHVWKDSRRFFVTNPEGVMVNEWDGTLHPHSKSKRLGMRSYMIGTMPFLPMRRSRGRTRRILTSLWAGCAAWKPLVTGKSPCYSLPQHMDGMRKHDAPYGMWSIFDPFFESCPLCWDVNPNLELCWCVPLLLSWRYDAKIRENKCDDSVCSGHQLPWEIGSCCY